MVTSLRTVMLGLISPEIQTQLDKSLSWRIEEDGRVWFTFNDKTHRAVVSSPPRLNSHRCRFSAEKHFLSFALRVVRSKIHLSQSHRLFTKRIPKRIRIIRWLFFVAMRRTQKCFEQRFLPFKCRMWQLAPAAS